MTIFVPIVLACLVTEPTMCRPFMGYVVGTESECMDSLAEAIYQFEANPDVYIAGLTCVEASLLDEQASKQ